jgi:NADH:ubiquinone oxidoreductase subunit E
MSEARRSVARMNTVALVQCTECGGDALARVVEVELATGEFEVELVPPACDGACAAGAVVVAALAAA